MADLKQLLDHGQSIWYDNMRRSMLESGEMQAFFDGGVRGVTSNPTIFDKAIGQGNDYDETISQLAANGKSTNDTYEALVLADIQRTADMLAPVYESSNGEDGYVSLEVSPKLARDTAGTVSEAKRFFEALDRPNVMIKIPATPEGIPAITEVIGSGINVNVTLMFSLDHYDAVAEAYIKGLEQLAANGGDVSKVASVASFFVSRVDSAVNKQLDDIGTDEAFALRGKIAIDNAKLAYERFKETFAGERWQALADKGANVQRPLWASTGTKDDAYPDTLYVDSLIGPHTVNTVPPNTLDAFLDHGTVAATLETDLDGAKGRMAKLADLSVSLDAITDKLQDDGVDSFAKSFDSLMGSIESKREALVK
ncbi:MAG: transaldolase [Deinococcota bacterium]